MSSSVRHWSLATSALVGSLLAGGLAAQAKHEEPALSPELAAAKAALNKYQDPILAVHDGYLSTLACIDYSQPGGNGEMTYQKGGMGIHFLNPRNIGPKLDPQKPQVLIYEPVGGKLTLAAAEWFVPTDVSKEPLTIFGKKLEGPMEGHEPVLPARLHHWDLHVWLWKANPSGLFSPTNPNLKCIKRDYSYSLTLDPPNMVAP